MTPPAAFTVSAPAKVNLFLRVLAREESGYHGIETLFCLVSLADTIVAERREGRGVTIDVSGAEVGAPEQNLAVRAAAAVLESVGNPFAVHLSLTKRIPVRAGLGGGSSDAAAALQAANRLAGDAIPRHELLQIGARIGSDVPFFLTGAPLALAWNRGERMVRLAPLPPAPALLLTPRVPVATAEAYGWVDAARQSAGRRGAVALDLDALSSWGDIARMAGNDFESPVFGASPGGADRLRSDGGHPAAAVPHERLRLDPLCYLSHRAGSRGRGHDAGAEAWGCYGGRDGSKSVALPDPHDPAVRRHAGSIHHEQQVMPRRSQVAAGRRLYGQAPRGSHE